MMGARVAILGATVAVAWCLLRSSPAVAADYYVDAAAAAGGNGSIEAPLKTIQAGLNAAFAGDNVIVRGGRYVLTSALSFPRGGAAGSPITLRAFAGESVLVEAQAGRNIALLQTDRSYLTVEDITFDGNYSTANGLIRLDAGGTFQTFRRCQMRRQGNHLLRIDSSDLLVEDCHIHHAIWPGNPSADAHCIHSQSGFRHTFRRCDVHHATGDLWQGSRDGAWGDIVFEHCDLHIELMDVTENGIAAGTPITENHLDTKNAPGITNSNVTVRYCTVRGSRLGRLGGPGGTDAALNLKDGVRGFYIYGNLIHNNQWAFRLRHPSTSYRVYNNFIYDNDVAVRLEDGVGDLAFLNNTFCENTRLIQDVASAPPLVWQNNIFSASAASAWPGLSTHNLFWSVPSGWPAGNGNFSANPTFVDATTYNLRLLDGSPAIDAGLSVAGVADDVDGDPRPLGTAFDIGADEFRLLGDINSDGHVDAADLSLLAAAWAAAVDHAGYSDACDLNRDGAIDIRDLLALGRSWGR